MNNSVHAATPLAEYRRYILGAFFLRRELDYAEIWWQLEECLLGDGRREADCRTLHCRTYWSLGKYPRGDTGPMCSTVAAVQLKSGPSVRKWRQILLQAIRRCPHSEIARSVPVAALHILTML